MLCFYSAKACSFRAASQRRRAAAGLMSRGQCQAKRSHRQAFTAGAASCTWGALGHTENTNNEALQLNSRAGSVQTVKNTKKKSPIHWIQLNLLKSFKQYSQWWLKTLWYSHLIHINNSIQTFKWGNNVRKTMKSTVLVLGDSVTV